MVCGAALLLAPVAPVGGMAAGAAGAGVPAPAIGLAARQFAARNAVVGGIVPPAVGYVRIHVSVESLQLMHFLVTVCV